MIDVVGVFLTFFILLVVISFGEMDIRIANQRFILPVATLMVLLATTVSQIAFHKNTSTAHLSRMLF
jgi:hypothetical protein